MHFRLKKAIKIMAERDEGKIICPTTKQEFHYTEVSKLYISWKQAEQKLLEEKGCIQRCRIRLSGCVSPHYSMHILTIVWCTTISLHWFENDSPRILNMVPLSSLIIVKSPKIKSKKLTATQLMMYLLLMYKFRWILHKFIFVLSSAAYI